MPPRRRQPSLISSLTDAESIARDMLAEVDAEALAEDLLAELTAVTLDDLNARAGQHSWGYVDPVEAAWELLEERLAPFRDEMLRLQGLGFEEQAIATLEGILMGLQALEGHRRDHYVLESSPDFEGEIAVDVVDKWVHATGRRKRRHSLPDGLLDECAPDFAVRIRRHLERKR